jgi:uncharacterized membrane protein
MGMRAWAILLAVLVFSGLAGLAAGQVVVLPDLGNTRITGISDDGRRVAGVVGDRLPFGNFFWSSAAGYEFPGHPNEGVSGLPLISGHGVWLAGLSGIGDQQTYLATSDGRTTLLPFSIPGQVNQSLATGISRDGAVVSGWDTHRSSSIQVGWRWSATGGMQVLPGFSFTLSMSGDGRTIFGGNGVGQYGMWRDGVVSPVPGALGRVQAVNYDGSIFAGDGRIWNNGQIITMPLLPGGGNPEISDISEDGRVVVGSNLMDLGRVPIVWTPTTGTQPLAAYFASFGYDLSGYTIHDVRVSADGRTFGLTTVPVGAVFGRGVVVTIPSPATMGLLLGLVASVSRRRL